MAHPKRMFFFSRTTKKKKVGFPLSKTYTCKIKWKIPTRYFLIPPWGGHHMAPFCRNGYGKKAPPPAPNPKWLRSTYFTNLRNKPHWEKGAKLTVIIGLWKKWAKSKEKNKGNATCFKNPKKGKWAKKQKGTTSRATHNNQKRSLFFMKKNGVSRTQKNSLKKKVTAEPDSTLLNLKGPWVPPLWTLSNIFEKILFYLPSSWNLTKKPENNPGQTWI